MKVSGFQQGFGPGFGLRFPVRGKSDQVDKFLAKFEQECEKESIPVDVFVDFELIQHYERIFTSLIKDVIVSTGKEDVLESKEAQLGRAEYKKMFANANKEEKYELCNGTSKKSSQYENAFHKYIDFLRKLPETGEGKSLDVSVLMDVFKKEGLNSAIEFAVTGCKK